MPEEERILIARFLRSNGLTQTLASFLSEAGLPDDAGSSASKDDLTLEKLLQEKRAYDLSANFEKLGTKDTSGWLEPAPTHSVEVKLATSANILAIAASTQTGSNGEEQPCLLSSGADRRVSIIDCGSLQASDRASSYEAPVLSMVVVAGHLMIGDMAGNINTVDRLALNILDRRKDHRKYVVKLAAIEQSDGTWLASAGWDASVYVYWIPKERRLTTLGKPIAQVKMPTIPRLWPLRDSTFLYYYAMPTSGVNSTIEKPDDLELLGQQNLAPHALSWVAFTPSDLALCPTDNTIVAVATSSMPHMKLLIVRLLFPASETLQAGASSRHDEITTTRVTTGPLAEPGSSDGPSNHATSVARSQLVLQNREEAAIIISCNTMAPQTQYSTPVVVWRPGGSGLFVNGDDGMVRGIEASTGKVVCRLEGHEPGSKIRCLWAGSVECGGGTSDPISQEWLVSGGFDQKLLVWRRPYS